MTHSDESGTAMAAPEQPIPADSIRRRAYELWERNHCPPGLELRFWLLAERQLRAEAESASAQGRAA